MKINHKSKNAKLGISMKIGKLFSHKKRGFTLIELLVVIAIIALLLSIIMPALRSAKKQAQAVICKSNLKQWGMCYSLYFEEWDSFFPPFVGGTVAYSTFMESLKGYYDDVEDLRSCPSAVKVVTDNPTGVEPLSFFGSTFTGWQIDPVAIWLSDEDCGLGSYGENSHIRSGSGSDETKSWIKVTNIPSRSDVPILADSRWNNAWPEDSNPIPTASSLYPSEASYDINNWSQLTCFVMRRHRDGVNVLLADISVERMPAESLWNLKWNREYQKRADVDLRWMEY